MGIGQSKTKSRSGPCARRRFVAGTSSSTVTATAGLAMKTAAPTPIVTAAPSLPLTPAVAVTGESDHPAVLRGQTTRVHTLVSIKAAPAPAPIEGAGRPPVLVACVLDQSGSMSGASLSYAKKAATKLVKHLGEQDALHFFTYDSDVHTIFTDGDLSDAGKLRLEQRIKQVRAGTSTNLLAGLEAGAAALRKSLADKGTRGRGRGGTGAGIGGTTGATGATARIMLFSDGMVNAGEKSREKIFSRVREYHTEGITVSTFGIGRGFDEPLMTGIAEHGRGYYGYLGTAVDIPRQVGKAMHSLLALAGTDATLTLTARGPAVITRVYGDGDASRATGGVATVSVPLGDLHVANTRSVLVELEIRDNAADGDCSGQQAAAPLDGALLEMGVSFSQPDSVGGARAACSGQVPIAFTAVEAAAAAVVGGGVGAALAIQRATDRDNEVMALVARGSYPAAARLQQVSVAELAVAAPTAGEYAELVASVQACAQDNFGRLLDDEGDEGDAYDCIATRCAQRLQRRLSNECLAERSDSDDDRDWSDGWSSGEEDDIYRGGSGAGWEGGLRGKHRVGGAVRCRSVSPSPSSVGSISSWSASDADNDDDGDDADAADRMAPPSLDAGSHDVAAGSGY